MDEVWIAINYFYADAIGLPWDGEEKTYAGPVSEVDDVVESVCGGAFEGAVYDKLTERLRDAIGWDTQWTDWGAIGDLDHLNWQWDGFASIVQTTSRFVVVQEDGPKRQTPSSRVAAFLRQLLIYVDGPLDLVRPVPSGSSFYRGRLVEERDEVEPTAEKLGPPPSLNAGANRMSPAGVALLYAAADPQTAIAEIAGHGVKPRALVARFESAKQLQILDLTRVPKPGSIF